MWSAARTGTRTEARVRGGGFFERVYAVVRQIPRGRVATYAQVAALVGVPRGARAVGWALGALGGARATEIPWHRVVGAGGRIAPRTGHGQRRRLRAEGIRFRGERVDLTRHGLFPGRIRGGKRPARSAGC